MTKIKMCGLMTEEDILAANRILPEYIGFVFWPGSRRYLSPQTAQHLKTLLDKRILTVGVFVDETPERITNLYHRNIIDLAQLHGREDGNMIQDLRSMTSGSNRRDPAEPGPIPVIQAFRPKTKDDIRIARASIADRILLDAGAGSGSVFDWALIRDMDRPWFLAGGLHPGNVAEAIRTLAPYAVDVSSGIETDGKKDSIKMAAFAAAVRKEHDL